MPPYYFWVALAACYFLRPAVAATHLALASAGYGIALPSQPRRSSSRL